MMTPKSMMAQLEKRRAAVAKERDKLRELESEIAALAECCDVAAEHLQDAIDALSELA